jgi:hypothetical protein
METVVVLVLLCIASASHAGDMEGPANTDQQHVEGKQHGTDALKCLQQLFWCLCDRAYPCRAAVSTLSVLLLLLLLLLLASAAALVYAAALHMSRRSTDEAATTANAEPSRACRTAASGGPCGSTANACCPSSQCCSQYNYCGTTAAHCGSRCQPAYGRCAGASLSPSPSPLPSPSPSPAGL